MVLPLFYHSQSTSPDVPSILDQYCFFFKVKVLNNKKFAIINLIFSNVTTKMQ